MPLLTINADFSRTAAALERIADVLTWILRLSVDPKFARAALAAMAKAEGKQQPPRPAGKVTFLSDEELADAEEERERRAEAELHS